LADRSADRIPGTVTLVLVGLISLGAIAIDITLVALPTMTSATGGELASSGLIVTTFLAGFAPGQLVWGYVGVRSSLPVSHFSSLQRSPARWRLASAGCSPRASARDLRRGSVPSWRARSHATSPLKHPVRACCHC
jgi:MFS family permease